MKAPMSKKARELLRDPKRAEKIIAAARKGRPVEVKDDDGTTYIVRTSSKYNPKDYE